MRIYFYIRLGLLTTFAILFGVFAHQILGYLHFLVGGVMTLYGVEGLIFSNYRAKKHFYKDYQFYLGQIEILLGIVMLSSVREFNTICVIWGTWTIVRESYELYEVSHKLSYRFPAFLSLALSVIEIIFSILLILFASEHHALTHIYLLIPEFIVIGLSPLLFEIHKQRHKH